MSYLEALKRNKKPDLIQKVGYNINVDDLTTSFKEVANLKIIENINEKLTHEEEKIYDMGIFGQYENLTDKISNTSYIKIATMLYFKIIEIKQWMDEGDECFMQPYNNIKEKRKDLLDRCINIIKFVGKLKQNVE
jgi:hypothetical protein